jgi:hypothetical protein
VSLRIQRIATPAAAFSLALSRAAAPASPRGSTIRLRNGHRRSIAPQGRCYIPRPAGRPKPWPGGRSTPGRDTRRSSPLGDLRGVSGSSTSSPSERLRPDGSKGYKILCERSMSDMLCESLRVIS